MKPGFGTHYVVLAYRLQIGSTSKLRADAQHSEYVWWEEPKILASDKVHENTKKLIFDKATISALRRNSVVLSNNTAVPLHN